MSKIGINLELNLEYTFELKIPKGAFLNNFLT